MKFLDYRYHAGKRGPRPIAFRLAARIPNLIRARIYNHMLRANFMPAYIASRVHEAFSATRAHVEGRFAIFPVQYGRSDEGHVCGDWRAK